MLKLFKAVITHFTLIATMVLFSGCVGSAPYYGESNAEQELTAEHR